MTSIQKDNIFNLLPHYDNSKEWFTCNVKEIVLGGGTSQVGLTDNEIDSEL